MVQQSGNLLELMQLPKSMMRRLVMQLRVRGYGLFGREPTQAEWEKRLRRTVADTVAQSVRWIPPGGSFVDVGANCGIYAEEVLRERPGSRAWLFEPVRRHYERCVQRLAKHPGVVIENFALGDESGPRTIWKAKNNLGGNLMDEELAARLRHKVYFRRETVQCRVFDDYAREQGLRTVDFIKSDTEGFDYRVLRGMLGFLEHCHALPVILAELMREDIHPTYAAQLEVLEELSRLGYRSVDLSGMADVQDFLFVPRGREPVA